MTHLSLAFRRLLQTPGFTAVTLGSLALCIGANLAIFAVVDAVLLRALPFPQAERLVILMNSYPGAGVDRAGASHANYFERRQQMEAFASLSLIQEGSVIAGEKGSPTRISMARVTPEFFATLGVPLARGSMFTEEALTYQTDQVAVLTDEFWRSYFNADPEVVGRTFLNDGLDVKILGVLPPGFRYLSSQAKFFRPASNDEKARLPEARHNNNYEMIGRLAPGASLAVAQEQLHALNASLLAGDPYAKLVTEVKFHTLVSPLREDHVRTIKSTLLLLQGGVFLLLLIGGVNLANLFLIRASGRLRELAIRRALGAAPRHVAAEVLGETLLLALGGGIAGIGLGALGVKLLQLLGTDSLPLGATIRLNFPLGLLSILLSLAVGGALGAVIIAYNLHARLAASLQSESRGGTAGRTAQRVRYGFIVVQIALAFILLTGAGLLGASLRRLLATSPGFRPDQIVTGQISLPWKSYPQEQDRLAFVERLIPALRSLPGVTSAALSTGLPFTSITSDSAVFVENYTPSADAPLRAHFLSGNTAEYWPTMGIPLLAGRFLQDADNQSEVRVCLADQAFAERYWPGESALGKRLCNGVAFQEEESFTVVGVVGSVKQRALSEEEGHGALYFPYKYFNSSYFHLVLRTQLPPTAIFPAIRQAILQLDPELPVDDLRSMNARIDDSMLARRSPALLALLFAAVALLLAALGTYGVLAYSVGQRRREIGIRLALGAQPRQVHLQFLGLGALLLGAGLLLGFPASWALGRTMQSVLFQVPAFHPVVLALASALLTVVVFLATALPSRQASRVDPAVVLGDGKRAGPD